jgi:predicted ester cyclase
MESLTAGGSVTGRSAITQIYDTWFRGFPDLVSTQDDLLIDGHRAAQLSTVSGTDTGGFLGLPPTGKPFRIPMLWMCAVKDNLIVHSRPIYDFTGLLVQIGVLKTKSLREEA